MSSIEQIANLLRSQIEQRRTLAIGTAQSASIQGTRALYQTPSGTISAIATNFCYGDCLLAKVEGTWYAINPQDNREVVRGSVDRLIQKRARIVAEEIGTIAVIKRFFGSSDAYPINIYFGSNQKIDIASHRQMELLNIDPSNKQLASNAFDQSGNYLYPGIYPYPLITTNLQGYDALRTRRYNLCQLIQINLAAFKAAMDSNGQYRYVYYGFTGYPGYQYAEGSQFSIDFDGANPSSRTRVGVVNSLALEFEKIQIQTSNIGGNIVGNYWQPSDFDQSYQRDPVNKLGIRNALYNDRWSVKLTGIGSYIAALNVFGTEAYGWEAAGHTVVRLDLQQPEMSAWVANAPADDPFYWRSQPSGTYQIRQTQVFDRSFMADDPNPDLNQNPYFVLNPY